MLVDFAIRTKCGLLTENQTLFRFLLHVSLAYRHRITCSFACHLFLRATWASACREFVIIYSGHHRLSLMESGFPEFLILGLLNYFFSWTTLTISSDIGDRPDPFLLHIQFSSLIVFCHIWICIAVGVFLKNSLANISCTVLFDCIRSSFKYRYPLFLSTELHFCAWKQSKKQKIFHTKCSVVSPRAVKIDSTKIGQFIRLRNVRGPYP